MDEQLAETLLLLISELVTNAVVHTGAPAELRIQLPGRHGDGAVRVEVVDGCGRPPRQRRADGDDTNGRGLELVSGLADRWGWQREGAGKRIWCELDRGAAGMCGQDWAPSADRPVPASSAVPAGPGVPGAPGVPAATGVPAGPAEEGDAAVPAVPAVQLTARLGGDCPEAAQNADAGQGVIRA